MEHRACPFAEVACVDRAASLCNAQHCIHFTALLHRSTTPALSESIPSSSDQAGPSTALVLTPRSNPRHLFVSSQLPSTGASSSFSPSPSSAPSANPEKAKAQDDQPSLSKQPGPDSDAAQDKRGEQGASRDKQPADEMQDDDENGNDAEKLTEAQVRMR